VIRFYCERCGKEMWELAEELAGWDSLRHIPLGKVKQLLVCSDCLLAEMRGGAVPVKVKKAQYAIQWVDDECVGYLCACGEKEVLIVSIYEDSPAHCPTCGRAYVLRQSNTVIELAHA